MQRKWPISLTSTQQLKFKKLIPNIISFLNACAGFMSILCSIQGALILAGTFIVVATLLDACDGRIARRLRVTSAFGLELDSLCDVVSFVIAPSLFIYSLRNPTPHVITACLFLYVTAGLYRLARFNISSPTAHKDAFIGLPTPLSTFILIVSITQLTAYHAPTWIIALTIVLVSAAMVSRIPVPSGK